MDSHSNTDGSNGVARTLEAAGFLLSQMSVEQRQVLTSLLEVERKLKEATEVEERLSLLEQAQQQAPQGHAGGYSTRST